MLTEIINNKLHIWNVKSHFNPKTREYCLDIVNNVVIIKPELIENTLLKTKEKINSLLEEWKTILVLNWKYVIKEELEALCERRWISYFSYDIPSWIITNFDTLLLNINKMKQLEEFISSEDFEKLTKKEKLMKQRQLEKIKSVYKWVKNLEKRPDFVLIIDWMQLKNFVNEVRMKKVDNLVIANTDFDMWWEKDKLLIANTNSYRSLMFIINYLLW